MFLKWIVGDFLFDTVATGLWKGAKNIFGPFLGKAWGTTASKVGEKFMEKTMSLLDEQSEDEGHLDDALPFLDSGDRAEFFGVRLGLILTQMAGGDLDLALEYLEWYRRLLIQKTPEQTAERIKEHLNMPPDLWVDYLMSGLSIRTKSKRYKYRHFWKVKAALQASAPSGSDISKLLGDTGRKLKGIYDTYSKKIDDWIRIRVLVISLIFAGLGFVIVMAYTFKAMALFIIFTLLLVFAISFVDAIWVLVAKFGVYGLVWLGLIQKDRVDAAIEMATDQSFLRYLRATQLVLLHLVTMAAFEPSLLFSKAIWAYTFIVIISAMVYLIAFGSKRSYLVPALGVHYFVILFLLFNPQPVMSAQTEIQNLQAKISLLTTQRKLSARTLFTVREKTLGLSIASRDEFGKPIKDGDKYRLVPCYIIDRDGNSVQMEFLPGQVYQVSEDAETIDAGEPLIKARQKNSDGTWLITDQTVECFIPYSKTELVEVKPKPTPAPIVSQTPTTSSAPAAVVIPSQKEVAKTQSDRSTKSVAEKSKTEDDTTVRSIYVPADAMYNTKIFVRRGQRIQMTASGQANSMPENRRQDESYRWVGPDGWPDRAPGFIKKYRSLGPFHGPLAGDDNYLALTARISQNNPSLTDGRWVKVGTYVNFVSDQDGYVYLVVNEKTKDTTGLLPEWLSNNQGGFEVQVRLL